MNCTCGGKFTWKLTTIDNEDGSSVAHTVRTPVCGRCGSDPAESEEIRRAFPKRREIVRPSELRQAAIELLNERLGANDYRVSASIDFTCGTTGKEAIAAGICVYPAAAGEMLYFVSGHDTPEKALERLKSQLPHTADLLAIGM